MVGEPVLISAYLDDECGCPVEEWVHCAVGLLIHYEPDGSLEVVADAGDWEHTLALKAADMDAARREAFAWVEALPTENEMAAILAARAALNPQTGEAG